MPNALATRGGVLQATASRAIPAPTLARARAVDAVAAYLALLRQLPQTRLGWIGDGLGQWIVPDRLKFFYVRLGGSDGEVAEARSITLLDPAYDDIVLLRKERPGGLGGWVILDWYGAGIPPLVPCEVNVAGIWYLYDGAVQFQLLSDFDPTVTNVPNWYSAWDGDYDAQFISPSTEFEIAVSAQTGSAFSLFHSPDRGTAWDFISTVTNNARAAKVRFDETNRDLGFVSTWQDLTGAEFDEIIDAVPVPTALFTPYVAGDYSFTRDYQPLRIQVTTDGGATYSAFIIEYFGQVYGFYTDPFGVGAAAIFGNITDEATAADYCAGPVHPYGVSYPTVSPEDCEVDPASGFAYGFVFCEDSVITDPPVIRGSATCAFVWVAPLHDNATVYVTAGVAVFNPDSFFNACVNNFSDHTNKLYWVDATGTILDSFLFATNGLNTVDILTHLETDRADATLVYGVTSKVYDFSAGVNTQSGKLFRLDWGTHTGTDISPHNPGTDLIARALSTSAGTLLVPATQGYLSATPHLVMWRSTDFGGSWTSVDLSVLLSVTYAFIPIVVEGVYGDTAGALVVGTRDGKVVYSLDDGMTWAVTSAGLFSGLLTLDVGA